MNLGGTNLVKVDPELILTFEWDGKTVHKETTGFTGKQCTELTSFVEASLKAKNEKKTFKPEYLKTEKKLTNKLSA